jgi:predicted pyridoxine 5'-phosphate oxidase superfamily flavin-nucleotide-binding protein
MSQSYLDIAATPRVKAAQEANGSRAAVERFAGHDMGNNRLTDEEREFIATRDSLYIATVSDTGWPYVQHRGGPPGFLKVLDDKTLGFVDFRGNRQYVTLGNATADDRAALILMDYAKRRRLKIYARIEPRDLSADLALAKRLALPGYRARPERAFLLHVEAFSWNCPQHITPRFTLAELEEVIEPLRRELAALAAENEKLRARLSLMEQASEKSHKQSVA